MPIYMRGQVRFFQEMDRLSKSAKEEVRNFVNETAARIEERALSKVPVASGSLKAAIKTVGATNADAPMARVHAIPWYALPVEFGYKGANATVEITNRHGNKGMRTLNKGAKLPITPTLIAWAKSKSINPWALAKSIQKKGTKKQPFFFQSMDEEAADFYVGMEELFADVILPAGASSGKASA